MRLRRALAKSPSDGGSLVTSWLPSCLLLLLTVFFGHSGRADESHPPTGTRASAEQVSKRAEDPRRPELEEFIRTYFRTWSDRDIEGYDACFLPNASIQFIDSRGKLTTYARAQFVADQRKHHRTARHRMTEVPESIDIRFESKLARAIVYWKLTAGPTIDFGYDHFTLIKHRGKWRIVNLVFYSVNPTP